MAAADEPVLDADSFRRTAGRFATGVTVATTLHDGVDHAMTASAFTSVSLEPPLVLLCVDRDARFHDAVLGSGRWGVSVLEAGARSAAQWLATAGRPLHGQLDRVAHHRGALTGAALLDEALATLEVATTAVHDGGDHSIVVAQVLSVATPRPDGRPLVYYRGGYAALP